MEDIRSASWSEMMKRMVVIDSAYWCYGAYHVDGVGTFPGGFLLASTKEALEAKIAQLMEFNAKAAYNVFGEIYISIIKPHYADRLKQCPERCIWVEQAAENPFLVE